MFTCRLFRSREFLSREFWSHEFQSREFRSRESHLSTPDHIVKLGSGMIKDSLKPQVSLVLFSQSFAKVTMMQFQLLVDV